MNTAQNNKTVSLLLGLGGMALVMSSSVANAGIAGSAHDLSANSFTGGQICVVCHVPHNGAEAGSGPLWNHALSNPTGGYTAYTSSTLDATIGDPTGPSKLCLSCHDGTVAVDSFGGATGSLLVDNAAFNDDAGNNGRNLGTDFTNDHPFSFDYTAVAGADAGIFAEGTTVAGGIGSAASKTKTGTIAQLMLSAGTDMQCTSCHDVHNEYTAASTPPGGSAAVDGYRLLKVSLDSSKLCLTCHDK